MASLINNTRVTTLSSSSSSFTPSSSSSSQPNNNVNHVDASKQQLLKIITIPNIVKFIKKCGAKHTNSFQLSVQLRKNNGSPTDIEINTWESIKNDNDDNNNNNNNNPNENGVAKTPSSTPTTTTTTTTNTKSKPHSYHYYIHGKVKENDNLQYNCGVYLDMDLLERRFALFGCECQKDDKTPGTACQHTLALLSYVREKIQHLPYNFVYSNYNNDEGGSSSTNNYNHRRMNNDNGQAGTTPVAHESYFKISHTSTNNEVFIPRDQHFLLGRLGFGKEVSSLYNDACCSRKQLVLNHDSRSNRLTLRVNRVSNHPRVYPRCDLNSYFFICPPLYTIELMNDYYFSMYFNKHIMKVEQFYKLVKVKTGGRGMDHDGGTISSPSTTIIDVDNNTTATSLSNINNSSTTSHTASAVVITNNNNNTNTNSNEIANEKNEKLMDQLECPICCDLLYKPVSIKCTHKFCESCWYSWALTCLNRNDKVRCPNCREETLDYISRVDTSTASICNYMFPNEYNERKNNVDETLVQINKKLLQDKMDELNNSNNRKKKRRKMNITNFFRSNDNNGGRGGGGGGGSGSNNNPIDLS